MSSTREIHFSNPETILSFYKNQPKTGVIHDSSYSKMLALNKIENDYVIPVTKKSIKPSSSCNTTIRNIDPNTAIVNQAKENIKNDVVQTTPIVTTNITPQKLKRKSSTCESSLKPKKPRKKRRQTIIGGDIFGIE